MNCDRLARVFRDSHRTDSHPFSPESFFELGAERSTGRDHCIARAAESLQRTGNVYTAPTGVAALIGRENLVIRDEGVHLERNVDRWIDAQRRHRCQAGTRA